MRILKLKHAGYAEVWGDENMKIYHCPMCGEHGCKLEVDNYGGKPMVCPYKYPNPEFELIGET